MSKKGSNTIKKTVFLDVGNSWVKAAYKQEEIWTLLDRNRWRVNEIIDFISTEEHNFERVVVASVRKDYLNIIENALRNLEIVTIDISNIRAEKLEYHTPETFGIDRFLGCFGAFTTNNTGVIVIDAGTACTIDYMNEEGVYKGGLIMPGLTSIVEIFKDKAPELPKIEVSIPDQWPGKSTKQSLQWGQIGFFREGLEGLIRKFFKEFGEVPVYVTGGDANIIAELISFETIQDEFLIFKGMEKLLG